jgi:hypothetical protein
MTPAYFAEMDALLGRERKSAASRNVFDEMDDLLGRNNAPPAYFADMDNLLRPSARTEIDALYNELSSQEEARNDGTPEYVDVPIGRGGNRTIRMDAGSAPDAGDYAHAAADIAKGLALQTGGAIMGTFASMGRGAEWLEEDGVRLGNAP